MTLSLALPPTASALLSQGSSTSTGRPVSSVTLHPVVLASILDSHLRRQPTHDRVFGTLLGPRPSSPLSQPGTLSVTEAFSVPYAVTTRAQEGQQQQVTIDIEHHRALLDLHLKSNPKIAVLGWFATSPSLNSFSALIHNFYSNEALASSGYQAVHLALDPESLDFKVYTAAPLGLASSSSGGEAQLAFVPVKHSVSLPSQERPSLDLLSSRLSSLSNLVPAPPASSAQNEDLSVPTPLEQLYTLLRQVTSMLDQVLAYVREVVEGERDGDEKVGRALLETVGSVPTLASSSTSEEEGAAEGAEKKERAENAAAGVTDFEEEFNAHLADVLMVSYLANVIKTQAELSSRLNLLV
ncbi:hypothetical protein JCM10908_001318 [Rhodotorula pacifica]|uniref:uncharacterized protein n=1 Tax=Rhodotorula pacifica TaxID=1495444 RepID=UPI00317DD80C